MANLWSHNNSRINNHKINGIDVEIGDGTHVNKSIILHGKNWIPLIGASAIKTIDPFEDQWTHGDIAECRG